MTERAAAVVERPSRRRRGVRRGGTLVGAGPWRRGSGWGLAANRAEPSAGAVAGRTTTRPAAGIGRGRRGWAGSRRSLRPRWVAVVARHRVAAGSGRGWRAGRRAGDVAAVATGLAGSASGGPSRAGPGLGPGLARPAARPRCPHPPGRLDLFQPGPTNGDNRSRGGRLRGRRPTSTPTGCTAGPRTVAARWSAGAGLALRAAQLQARAAGRAAGAAPAAAFQRPRFRVGGRAALRRAWPSTALPVRPHGGRGADRPASVGPRPPAARAEAAQQRAPARRGTLLRHAPARHRPRGFDLRSPGQVKSLLRRGRHRGPPTPAPGAWRKLRDAPPRWSTPLFCGGGKAERGRDPRTAYAWLDEKPRRRRAGLRGAWFRASDGAGRPDGPRTVGLAKTCRPTCRSAVGRPSPGTPSSRADLGPDRAPGSWPRCSRWTPRWPRGHPGRRTCTRRWPAEPRRRTAPTAKVAIARRHVRPGPTGHGGQMLPPASTRALPGGRIAATCRTGRTVSGQMGPRTCATYGRAGGVADGRGPGPGGQRGRRAPPGRAAAPGAAYGPQTPWSQGAAGPSCSRSGRWTVAGRRGRRARHADRAVACTTSCWSHVPARQTVRRAAGPAWAECLGEGPPTAGPPDGTVPASSRNISVIPRWVGTRRRRAAENRDGINVSSRWLGDQVNRRSVFLQGMGPRRRGLVFDRGPPPRAGNWVAAAAGPGADRPYPRPAPRVPTCCPQIEHIVNLHAGRNHS